MKTFAQGRAPGFGAHGVDLSPVVANRLTPQPRSRSEESNLPIWSGSEEPQPPCGAHPTLDLMREPPAATVEALATPMEDESEPSIVKRSSFSYRPAPIRRLCRAFPGSCRHPRFTRPRSAAKQSVILISPTTLTARRACPMAIHCPPPPTSSARKPASR